MIDTIDLTYLKTIFSTEKDISEILKIYISEMQLCVSILDKALSGEDFVTIKNQAHKMKSSVGYIGLKNLEAQFQILEKAIPDSPENKIRYLNEVKDVINNCDNLGKEMSSIEENLPSP